MKFLRKYEILILLNEKFNDDELRSWACNYAKNLRRFNVSDISVISRGKHKFAYSIKNKLKGNYIQLNFASTPKYVETFLNRLKIDQKVLRCMIVNKEI